MSKRDARRTAQLHVQHLSLGLFPRLGLRFMTRWHETFTTSEHAWGGVVVDTRGDVVAMALISTDQHAYLADVLTNERRSLAVAGTAGLVTHPVVLLHFLRTRLHRYCRRVTGTAQPGSTRMSAGSQRLGVVHAVVTDDACRGIGCARALLQAAEDHARRRGTHTLALVTEHPDLDHPGATVRGAAAMYEKLGWERTAIRTRDDRRVAEYRRHLRPRAQQPAPTHEDLHR